jgi:excisionase family DNA binding protein
MSGKNSEAVKRVKPGPAARKPEPNKPESMECRTLRVEQAAEILGISRAVAYIYARDGTLPTIRLGKRLLVPKAAIDKLFAECVPA